jgi:DMSO/TMAO reductase YedYZ molybdopterin-dependent catalytic subunit
MSGFHFTRRRVAGLGAASLGSLLLGGCGDRLSESPSAQDFLQSAEGLTMRSQRLLQSRTGLVREFSAADISPKFKSNGSHGVNGEDYARHVEAKFADWRIAVTGLVSRPLTLSLADIRALPQRTQITRHDCVEGWSAIGQWTGVPLGLILKSAGLALNARYVVFHCADNLNGEPDKGGTQSAGQYYESIDLIDAFHPQTILAHSLNGSPLPVGNGAPLRLRVERQLGYKQAKYIRAIEITDRMNHLAGGKGGYWEDRGYEWYAGI